MGKRLFENEKDENEKKDILILKYLLACLSL